MIWNVVAAWALLVVCDAFLLATLWLLNFKPIPAPERREREVVETERVSPDGRWWRGQDRRMG